MHIPCIHQLLLLHERALLQATDSDDARHPDPIPYPNPNPDQATDSDDARHPNPIPYPNPNPDQAADSDDARHVLLDSSGAAELKVAPLLQAFLYDPQRLRDL